MPADRRPDFNVAPTREVPIVRAVMPSLGLRGAAATGLHLALVWGSALTLLPALGLAPPVTRWPKKQALQDFGMHAIYSLAVGAVADRLLTSKSVR